MEEVSIDWKKQSMSSFVNQFLKIKPAKGSYVFGFSYGAMIAVISARKIKPGMLILCSLSPYFSEDIGRTKAVYGKRLDKYHSKKLLDGFKKYRFNRIAKSIECKTLLLAGDKETIIRGKNRHLVLNRAKDAKSRIRNSRLIIVRNGKHNIAGKEYDAALRKVINRL